MLGVELKLILNNNKTIIVYTVEPNLIETCLTLFDN